MNIRNVLAYQLLSYKCHTRQSSYKSIKLSNAHLNSQLCWIRILQSLWIGSRSSNSGSSLIGDPDGSENSGSGSSLLATLLNVARSLYWSKTRLSWGTPWNVIHFPFSALTLLIGQQ